MARKNENNGWGPRMMPNYKADDMQNNSGLNLTLTDCSNFQDGVELSTLQRLKGIFLYVGDI